MINRGLLLLTVERALLSPAKVSAALSDDPVLIQVAKVVEEATIRIVDEVK